MDGGAIVSNDKNLILKHKNEVHPDLLDKDNFMITFSKSSSKNFNRAIYLAKQSDHFLVSKDEDENEIYQAIFKPSNYLNFITLYELIKGWKSTFVFKDNQMMDRKILGQVNYCYGDKLRSGSDSFCYGASMFTENPFGCHRLMIHSGQRPWYRWVKEETSKYIFIDKEAMKNQIDEKAEVYHHCPAFDYNKIISKLHDLPDKIDKNSSYYKTLVNKEYDGNLTISVDIQQPKLENKRKTGCLTSALLFISMPLSFIIPFLI